MAINKNFVIKNGVQVATDLIVGDSDTKKVGIGTTVAGYTLHVGATNAGGRGGIGATDAVITGVGTIKDLLVTGFSGFSSAVSVTGVVSARSFGIGTTEVIDRGLRLSGIASLDAITINTIEQAIRVGPNSFTDLKVTGISTFIGIATFSTGIDIKSGVSTFSAPLRLGFAHTTDHAGVALGATVGFGTSAFFRDDAAIFMGSDSDLKIHHDGSNSRIQDVGTGDLIIQGSADIKLQSASAENYIVANDTGSVDVYFDNSKKLETTSGGLKVTGITTLTNRLHVEAGISTFDADVRFGIGATVGFGTSAFFRDDAAIFLGNDLDLKIHHDGSNSRIQDVGTGDLILQGSADIKLQSASAENYIVANDTGSVEIYYDNSKKLESTSGGLNVTGITTFSDRINVVSGVSTFQDNAKLTFGAQSDLIVYHSGSHSFIQDTTGTGNLYIDSNSLQIRNAAGDETQATFAENGAVSLFYDDGNVFQTTPQGVNVSGVTTSNRLNISGVSTFTSIGSNLIPDTDGSRSIGAATSEWQDLFIDGTANIDTLAADTAAIGDLTDNRVVIAGTSGELEDDANFTFDGSKLNVGSGVATVFVTTGNAAFAGIVTTGGALLVGAGATISGDILPDADGSRDLGSATLEFQDLFIDGTANIDTLAADTAAIGDLTDNRVVIAGTSGELEDDANLTFDGSKLNVGSGVATVFVTTGNVAFAGIATVGGALLVGAGVTVGGDILPDADGSRDLGSSTLEFQDLHLDGTANIDTLDVDGTANFADDVTLVAAGSSTILFDASAHDLIFQDNIRAKFGTGSDLDIHHNGTDSVITNATGDLNIKTTGDDINITAADDINLLVQGNENGLAVKGDGEVILYHNSNARVTTTSDGADFGGTGSIRVPNGTTGERNGSPASGDFRYNTTTSKFEGYTDEWGDIGGSGGVEETSTSVSSTSATSTGSFAIASFRSASIIAQITQGSNYQVGRYLVIHDGTTVTTIEESAVATGSMLGTFEGVINSSNLEFRVTMGSSSSATVTTKIDTVTV